MEFKFESKNFTCSLCGEESFGYGHNPEPILPFDKRCCDACNHDTVIPERIRSWQSKKDSASK